ncbi:MAG: YjbQ family protein [Polyangiaceae bacterium]|nr:YjbQ family protein [Polyangiaceae bacterium]
MSAYQETLEIRTSARGMVNVTREIVRAVERSRIKTGICVVFVQHTSASLVIQENADPSVRRDLARWIDRLAPESTSWEHDTEGSDDMPAHARAVMTRTSETIPVSEGRLALGTWQGIYVWEHRAHSHVRSLLVHVQGEAS